MRNRSRVLLSSAVLLGTVVTNPAMAVPLPKCEKLTDPAYGLSTNPQISNLTATFYPAGADVVPNPFGGPPSSNANPYCRVDFTLSTVCGAAGGYFGSQCQQLGIRVGLPASIADNGSGGAQGAWNGKNRDLGGGGYVGAVGPVFSSTDLGYVGSSTDTGHSTPGGSFALNPDGTLNSGLILDFVRNGIHEQHVWGVQLAQTYYGLSPARKYWMGCSTGGRQGHYQAQNFPNDFDGILAGAPAFNWDRFVTAELWPQVVMNNEVHAVISPTKLTAVTNAAIQACDPKDGITDGIIQDPRSCTYSATQFVCTGLGGHSTDPNCLTPSEGAAVDKIWNGPKDSNSNQAWYGLERGTFLELLAGGPPFNGPFPIATDHFTYWIHQNPSFDWHTVTESSFFTDLATSINKFEEVIGSDEPLKDFRKAGGKMITYHGLADPLIFPRGTYHYYNQVLQGNYKETQKYYRFFPYPGGSHCTGGVGPQIDAEALFSDLVQWVENAVAPDYVVAQQTIPVVRTRKICMYPNVEVFAGGKGSSTDDESNFQCQEQKKDNLIDTLAIGKPYEPNLPGQP